MLKSERKRIVEIGRKALENIFREKKVAFNTRGGGGFEVAVTDLAGGGTRTLGEGNDPVWGADSRHLIFASGGSLILLDAVSGQRSTLVSGVGKVSEPAWSR